jgi:hypothetical protein
MQQAQLLRQIIELADNRSYHAPAASGRHLQHRAQRPLDLHPLQRGCSRAQRHEPYRRLRGCSHARWSSPEHPREPVGPE